MNLKSDSKIKVYLSNIIYFVLIFIIGILAINFLSRSDKLFNILKLRNYVILSGSMEPHIMTGDMVFVKKASANDVQVGDVITFNYDEYVVTHRLMDKDETSGTLGTKGDNNDKPDNKRINNEDVIGKVVFRVPYVGYLITYISKPISLMIFMALAGIYILWKCFKE
ncbi:MAG: signal peptidase I [Sarcina sp.]